MTTAREQIRDRIRDALWTELEHQRETLGPFESLYVNRDDSVIDGDVDMDAAADTILSVFDPDEPDQTMYAYMHEIGWW